VRSHAPPSPHTPRAHPPFRDARLAAFKFPPERRAVIHSRRFLTFVVFFPRAAAHTPTRDARLPSVFRVRARLSHTSHLPLHARARRSPRALNRIASSSSASHPSLASSPPFHARGEHRTDDDALRTHHPSNSRAAPPPYATVSPTASSRARGDDVE